MNRSPTEEVDDKIIHASLWLGKDPAQIFAYWTESELLTKWLAPVARVDPQLGGKYELFWQPAEPENNSTIGCRITAFQEDQLLAFQWRSSQEWENARIWQARAWEAAFRNLQDFLTS